jgi:hypothetical protein
VEVVRVREAEQALELLIRGLLALPLALSAAVLTVAAVEAVRVRLEALTVRVKVEMEFPPPLRVLLSHTQEEEEEEQTVAPWLEERAVAVLVHPIAVLVLLVLRTLGAVAVLVGGMAATAWVVLVGLV